MIPTRFSAKFERHGRWAAAAGGLAILLACAAAWASETTTTASTGLFPPDPFRIVHLREHGLTTSPETLLLLLEDGFPPGKTLADYPPVPALKTQVLIDAIVELSRLQYRQAVPVLLLLARGTPTAGMRRVVQMDLAQQRPGDREQFERNLLQTLRLNAIVALGLIGGVDFTQELEAVFDEEKAADLRIATALALASIGSPAGLPWLVDQVDADDHATAEGAAKALRDITGLSYGPMPDDPMVKRSEAVREWRNWWKENRRSPVLDREQILRRRLAPPVRPNPREPRTVRDLLDAIVYPADGRWTLDNYAAYEQLRQMGAGALEQMEPIINDERENLAIRRQAILLYTQTSLLLFGGVQGEGRQDQELEQAYRIVRSVRHDENPEIREAARECAERLKK